MNKPLTSQLFVLAPAMATAGDIGAVGGDKDDICAKAALKAVEERLEFAD